LLFVGIDAFVPGGVLWLLQLLGRHSEALSFLLLLLNSTGCFGCECLIFWALATLEWVVLIRILQEAILALSTSVWQLTQL